MTITRLMKRVLKNYTPSFATMWLERWANASAMETVLTRLHQRGYVPSGVIDVGAYHGEWTRLAKKIWPDSPVWMFEAQEQKMGILEAVSRRLKYVHSCNALLGEKDGDKRAFFTMETGSSMYEERTSVPRNKVDKMVTTLDKVLNNGEELGNHAFLKVDVQGSELEVLRGAPAVLSRCEFVLLECSVVEYNRGAPLFGEVLAAINAAGFKIYDFAGLMRLPNGVLGQMDVLFCKEDSGYRPNGVLW